MYLTRLHRYNATLNNVVTFLDDHGLAEAKRRTRRSPRAATRGRCTGFRGAPRTSSRSRASRPPGARRFQGAGVRLRRQRRRDAARGRAVLIAKVSTGELAAATTGSAGRPRARGIRRRARADRRPAPRRPRPPAASASPSAPRPADRSSAPRPAAASRACVPRSGASAVTA